MSEMTAKGILRRCAGLILLGVLVFPLLGLIGCSGGDDSADRIVIGFEGDLTGPAAKAVIDVYNGFWDYFQMAEDEGLLPGIDVSIVHYDTKTEYGRVPAGYEWLKTRDAQVMAVVASMDREVLAARYEEDRIPAVGTQGSEILQGNDWNFSLFTAPEAQGEAILQWIMENWDYDEAGRKPIVGHAGMSGILTSVAYQRGIDRFLTSNGDQFEWKGHKLAPVSSATWVNEINTLKDCDYIVCSMVGPGTALFTKEARDRGYVGRLVSGMEAFPGYWELVRGAVSPSSLYDCYYAHYQPWWNDDNSFVADAREAVTRYRSQAEAAAQMRGTGYLAGWAWGVWLSNVITRAVEDVGADQVDAVAIRDALASTDMDVDGWGNTWKITETNSICARTQRVYQWNVDDEDWIACSDWILPPSADVI